MSETLNMICPNCGTFQPRSEVCNKCGVIIAKASNVATNIERKDPIKRKAGLQLAAKWVVLISIVTSVIGFALFAKTGKDTQLKPEDEIKPIDKIAAYNPAVANNIQRNNVLAKLHKLKTVLNMYLVQEAGPPSNEEELQLLVSKGYLSQADITDEWGNVFVYRLEWGEENAFEKKYTIFVHSKGPDGVTGNSDDVAMW